MDFYLSVNRAWQYYQTPKSTITSEQFCLLNSLSQFCLQFNFVFCTSKSKMAFSCHNSSTLVLLLGTLFNTISYFSNQMAYSPNALQCLRRIYQRGHLSLRSLSSTIQPGQTVLSVSGPSIVSVDNNLNWENALANPITNNNIANRPISSTCSWSKPCWSKNTNKQLANILGWLTKYLILIRLPVPILIQEKLKPISLTSLVALSLTSLIIFCFNITYISMLIWYNLI